MHAQESLELAFLHITEQFSGTCWFYKDKKRIFDIFDTYCGRKATMDLLIPFETMRLLVVLILYYSVCWFVCSARNGDNKKSGAKTFPVRLGEPIGSFRSRFTLLQ